MRERDSALDAEPVELDFDQFFRDEQPKMVALVIAMTGAPEVARDLAQDSFVKAYRAWASVRSMDKPGAWLRRVTINAAISWHRSNQREASARARLQPPVSAEPAEVESQQFWAAVRALPERQLAAIALYYLEDMSIADIATALDVTHGTVKASLFQARAALAKRLGLSGERGDE